MTDPISDALGQRFVSKVNFDGPNGCWLWAASLDHAGYGKFRHDGKMRRAHRVAWSRIRGDISSETFLDHYCATPACVNPAHLRLSNNTDNSRARTKNQRNSTSGIRGVHWSRADRKWCARIKVDGRRIFLGRFDDIRDAEIACLEARRDHYGPNGLSALDCLRLQELGLGLTRHQVAS